MSLAIARVDSLFSSVANRLSENIKARFEQALKHSPSGKFSSTGSGNPATFQAGPRAIEIGAAQLYSLSAASMRSAYSHDPVFEDARPPDQPDHDDTFSNKAHYAPTTPKIEMEPTEVDEGSFWWSDVSDIQPVRVPGANGETLCRVRVDAWEETATVYDKDNRMIVRFDQDILEAQKGEAWKDEYKLGNYGVRITSGPVKATIYAWPYLGEGGVPGEMNHVAIEREEAIGAGNILEGLPADVQTDRLDMFAITVEEAATYPERAMPLVDTDDSERPEDFSNEGKIGYTLASERKDYY